MKIGKFPQHLRQQSPCNAGFMFLVLNVLRQIALQRQLSQNSSTDTLPVVVAVQKNTRYSACTNKQKAKAVTLAFAPEPFSARGGSDQKIFTTQWQVCHGLRLGRLIFCNALWAEKIDTMSKIGRNAGSGQFTTVKQAQARPSTHVVETIKPASPPPKPTPNTAWVDTKTAPPPPPRPRPSP